MRPELKKEIATGLNKAIPESGGYVFATTGEPNGSGHTLMFFAGLDKDKNPIWSYYHGMIFFIQNTTGTGTDMKRIVQSYPFLLDCAVIRLNLMAAAITDFKLDF